MANFIQGANACNPKFFMEYLAKTYNLNGRTVKGRDVLSHCQIVGMIARSLVDQMDAKFRSFFPEGSDLLAAIHDNGKLSPTFQEKINRALEGYERNSGQGLASCNPDHEKQWGGHAGTGKLTLEYYIEEKEEELDNPRNYKYLPDIVGAHHGGNTKSQNMACDKVLGGQEWNDKRIELIEYLKEFFKTELPVIKDELQARIAAGLTVVSDWIGSGSIFDDPGDTQWESKIPNALNKAGFKPVRVKGNLSFKDIFGFEARPAQESLINACAKPGVYVLEAPMGSGKTEAALYCAYKMLAGGYARGIYFALPTQITSNKIYDRFKPFIEKISMEPETVRLLHSNAMLYEFGAEAAPGGSWFNGSKRGLLAPFAVGTIDQALMSAMNVRHSSVRAFGLFGKVVILDEVHTYDAYTGTILDKLVKDLAGLGCTVIILSATLTKNRRKEITGFEGSDISYPLITAIADSELSEYPCARPKDRQVIIEQRSFAEAAKIAANAAAQGQQVLWIENTVGEAQEAFKTLAAAGEFECGLLHSRFMKCDRSAIEDKWVKLYGPDNPERYSSGRILVGTQVLEQSLDIDADLLITRMAPADFILQRIGRLWRHDIKRHKNAETRCIIMPVENMEKDSGLVYSPYVLERTAEVLAEYKNILVPGMIRQVIEKTYEERGIESEQMMEYKKKLEEKKSALRRFALQSFSKISYPYRIPPQERDIPS